MENMFGQVPDFHTWFPETEGLPHPEWKKIREWIRDNVTPERLDDAWHEVVREWLTRLCERLGGSYRATESTNFHLLSEQDEPEREKLLSFLEKTRRRIVEQLGDLTLPKLHGKHVVLRFTQQQDYYRYVSAFHDDGEYAASSGLFLRAGYMHIAYPHLDEFGADHETLVHELAHNLLGTLPLPLWLNEGLVMAFESDIAGRARFVIDREKAREHAEYWNAVTIQNFWRGDSFFKPESSRLSYALARILLNLIATELRPEPEAFREFVRHAHRKDAGESAALEALGIDLNDLVSTFLGPGDWAPKGIA